MVEVLEIGDCSSTVHLYRQVWHAMAFFSVTESIFYMCQVLVVMKDIEEWISYGQSLGFCLFMLFPSFYQKKKPT